MNATWLRAFLTPPRQQLNPQPPTFCVQLDDHIALHYAIINGTVLFAMQASLPDDTAYVGIGLSELGSMKGADMAIFVRQGAMAGDDGGNASEPEAAQQPSPAFIPTSPRPGAANSTTGTGAGGTTSTTASNSTQAGSSSSETSLVSPLPPGPFRLVDAYASGFVAPRPDVQQDLVQLQPGVPVWSRPLVTCDTAEDLPLQVGMPVLILWAHGRSWGYHGRGNRGSKHILFGVPADVSDSPPAAGGAVDGVQPRAADRDHHDDDDDIDGIHSGSGARPALLSDSTARAGSNTTASVASGGATGNASAGGTPQDVSVLDLVFPVEIPAKETTYWVHYFKLPDDRKYHILEYEPIAHSPMLHHGVAYACSPSDAAKVEALPQGNMGPYDRFKQGMLCEQFFMLLTPNITPWHAPPVAGLPFGANSTRYIALELHYNNPEGEAGHSDPGSGIRIHYTSQLRRHDTGLLTINQPILEIPAGLSVYPVNVSVCPIGCTSRLRQPINLLEGFFHMHGLGLSAIARHYRGNRELAPLGQLRAFEYNYQGGQQIYAPDARVLLPGDIVTLQCVFRSTSRRNTTKGGAGTQDEMCFYWITYWPAQADMGSCYSIGNATLAVCGADVKSDEVFDSLSNSTLMTKLMMDGTLIKFPGDPAANSTRYGMECGSSH